MTFYTWNCPPLRGPRLAAVNNDSKDETDKVIQDLNIDGIWQMDLSESYAKEGEYERWQVEITTNGRSIQFKDVTAPDSRPNLKGNITRGLMSYEAGKKHVNYTCDPDLDNDIISGKILNDNKIEFLCTRVGSRFEDFGNATGHLTKISAANKVIDL